MPEIFAVLLLAVWAGAIVVLVNVERADKLLWIPVLLAVAGMFSAILPLAISFNVAMIANGATLTLFMVSLEMLNPQHQLAIARIRHRTRQ
ncbi:MAG: hypothetical protein ABSD96_07560 [Candidatus Korobacteraceae bacterium]|jgi:hypothetical protein